jgi:hypothetical protein
VFLVPIPIRQSALRFAGKRLLNLA